MSVYIAVRFLRLTLVLLNFQFLKLKFFNYLFLANGIPEGYRAQFINGFVEELVMNDDPEYQWIDKIRFVIIYLRN